MFKSFSFQSRYSLARYLLVLGVLFVVSAVHSIAVYAEQDGEPIAKKGAVEMAPLEAPTYPDGARDKTPGYGSGSQVTADGKAAMEAAAKQTVVNAAATNNNATPTSPNALQPAGLYAIPDGHERVKAAPKNCNLIDNIGESMGLGKNSIIDKGLSSISINTPYVSGTIGGCDPSVAPVLDGPGAQDGLELFKRDYKGNKYGSAMGTLAGWTNFALPFVSIIAIIAIIYAGFLYLTAFGNEEQTGKAKKIIIWVVVGIVIIISAYALVNTVISGSSG